MRIQNEGTGKSSWWVINPDAKPGKTPRRRAGSMETKSYEKRRGRVKKKVEALRQAMENNNSPSSTTDDYLNDSSLGYQLSPEFRQRTSSNASSCGRLSPIQAGIEPDLHDNQVPPMSPIPWGSEENSNISYDQLGQYDQLVDTLVDSMKLGDNSLGLGPDGGRGMGLPLDQNDIEMLAESNNLQQQILSGGDGMNNMTLSQFNDQSANYEETAQYGNMPAPPTYTDALRRSPQQPGVDPMTLQNGNFRDMGLAGQGGMGMYNPQPEKSLYPNDSLSLLQQQTSISPASSQLSVNTQQQQLSSPALSPQGHQQISPNYGRGYVGQGSPQTKQMSPQLVSRQQHHVQASVASQRSLLQQCLEAPPESLLRAALTQKPPTYQMPTTQQQAAQYNNSIRFGNTSMNTRQMPTGGMNSNGINNNITSSAQHLQQQHMSGGGMVSNMPQMPLSSSQLTSSLSSVSGQNLSQQTQGSSLPQVMPTGGGGGMPLHNPSSNSLNEIDPDFFDLGCDVEQVLQHELSLEGTLDFNFDPVNSATSSTDTQNMVR